MEFPLENLNGLLLPLAALTVISGLVGLVIGMLWRRSKAGEMEEKAQKRAQRLFKEMEVQRRAEMLEEKRKWHDAREAQEEEINRRQSALVSQEQDMMDREKECEQRYDNLKDREDQTSQREDELEKSEERLNAQEVRLKESASEYRNRLESLARLTSEEAKQQLHDELIRDVKQEAEHQVRDILKTAQTNANREARKIVTLAISRCAVDQSTQTSVAVVPLPNDQIKARIIGKDGRNIRTFEAASEVKVMVDDTPEAVVISCFDPIRREIARTAMADLVSNGKITQSRIEEIIGAGTGTDRQPPALGRTAGRQRTQTEIDAPRDDETGRPAAVPVQLWPERPGSLEGGGVPHRYDGRRDRPGRTARAALRTPA